MSSELPLPASRDELAQQLKLIVSSMAMRMAASGFELGIDYCDILGSPKLDVVLIDTKTGKSYFVNHPITDIIAQVDVPDDLSGLLTGESTIDGDRVIEKDPEDGDK